MTRWNNIRKWKGSDPPPDWRDHYNPVEQLYIIIEKNTMDFVVPYHNNPTYRCDDPCAYCGHPSDTWDHIEPLAQHKKKISP